MGKITIDSVLNRCSARSDLPSGLYEAELGTINEKESKYQGGGKFIKGDFTIIGGEFEGTTVSLVTTFVYPNGQFGSKFAELVQACLVLTGKEDQSFDLLDLIGSKCRVFVENKPDFKWPKVTKVMPLSQQEAA